MSTRCERCGEPASPLEGASHVFCERCASIASTGARDSSELLFTAPPMNRESREDLSALASPSAPTDEPLDLSPLLSVAKPAMAPPPRRRGHFAGALAVGIAAMLVAGSGALAWHAVRPVRSAVAVRQAGALATASAPERARAHALHAPALGTSAREQTPTEPRESLAPPPPSAPATRAAATSAGSISAGSISAGSTSAGSTSAGSISAGSTSAGSTSAGSTSAGSISAGSTSAGSTSAGSTSATRAVTARSPAPRRARAQTAREPLIAALAPITTAQTPRPALDPLPGRSAVRDAMDAVAEPIAQCAEGSHGLVHARVTFLGSGRAVHAEVVDASFPPAVRSCMARALRSAHLPAFGRDRFTIAYPYRL